MIPWSTTQIFVEATPEHLHDISDLLSDNEAQPLFGFRQG